MRCRVNVRREDKVYGSFVFFLFFCQIRHGIGSLFSRVVRSALSSFCFGRSGLPLSGKTGRRQGIFIWMWKNIWKRASFFCILHRIDFLPAKDVEILGKKLRFRKDEISVVFTALYPMDRVGRNDSEILLTLKLTHKRIVEKLPTSAQTLHRTCIRWCTS